MPSSEAEKGNAVANESPQGESAAARADPSAPEERVVLDDSASAAPWCASRTRSSSAPRSPSGSTSSRSRTAAFRSRASSRANCARSPTSTVPVGILDTTLYRDDLLTSGEPPALRRTEMPSAVDDHIVVLVDDVVKTGPHDPRRDGRADGLRPAARGAGGGRSSTAATASCPIKLDYVGKNVPTRAREQVQLRERGRRTRGPLELVIIGAPTTTPRRSDS